MAAGNKLSLSVVGPQGTDKMWFFTEKFTLFGLKFLACPATLLQRIVGYWIFSQLPVSQLQTRDAQPWLMIVVAGYNLASGAFSRYK